MEASTYKKLQVEASRLGWRLWRNNVGACMDMTGRFIRYGLANESKQVNAILKSSDLIGVRPILISSEHVGRVIGQFVALEVKSTEWKYRGTQREQAQKAFLGLVERLGGYSEFKTDSNLQNYE